MKKQTTRSTSILTTIITIFFTMKKIHSLAALSIAAMFSTTAMAQVDKYKDYREVYRDTVDVVAPTYTRVVRDTVFNGQHIMTNGFLDNWFVFATGGVHTFFGDYSNYGAFSGTLSPDFGIGIGKWVTPGFGFKAEFIRSNSRGYTNPGYGYRYGDIMTNAKGQQYRKMKTNWWDLSINGMFNLTRLIYGYEGYNSPRLKNQIMMNFGIGGVHHMGLQGTGSDNEWSGHAELQYSRFFTKRKNFSFDVKARALVYQTNFDLEYGIRDKAANKFDANVGIDLGFTYYFGQKHRNTWTQTGATIYERDYRERKIEVVKVKEGAAPVKYNTMTFYVFYPNNYSGRNDAPIVANAPVNAIDYLAGGLYTQKKFSDNAAVTARLNRGANTNGLAFVDIPTEPANKDFTVNYVPRGYEMSNQALSLSLQPDEMISFQRRAGYFYAPIFDGNNAWQYRIDNETWKQRLASEDNYKETNSYQLNAHAGLGTIRQYLKVDNGDEFVSFADVYAAMTSNNGYIAKYADASTVARIKNILENGTITMIQAEGLATSQDNYSGADAAQVGLQRNNALSQNRANTVITWLKSKERLQQVASQIFLVNSLDGAVREVKDASTRGLNAKLNRCVKVRIHYMLR